MNSSTDKLLAIIRPRDPQISFKDSSIYIPWVESLVNNLLCDAVSYLPSNEKLSPITDNSRYENAHLIVWHTTTPAPIYSHPCGDSLLTAIAIGTALLLPKQKKWDNVSSENRYIERWLYASSIETHQAFDSFVRNDTILNPVIELVRQSAQKLVLAVIKYHSGGFADSMFPHLVKRWDLEYIKSSAVYEHTPQSKTNLQNGWYVLFRVKN